MIPANLESHLPPPSPRPYNEVPDVFRTSAIDVMNKTVGWSAVKDAMMDAYRGRQHPADLVAWYQRRKYDVDPFLSYECQWWLFLLVIKAVACQLADAARGDGLPHRSYVDERSSVIYDPIASADIPRVAAKFETEINRQCERFGLVHRLRQGEIFRLDLEVAALLRDQALEIDMDAKDREYLEAAWDALNALPEPRYGVAISNSRYVIERLRKRMKRHVNDPKKAVDQNVLAGMRRLYDAASIIGSHDKRRPAQSGGVVNEPTRADAIGIVSMAMALVAFCDAMDAQT